MAQSTEPITLERSIWINAPRERVWQAVTQPEEIQQWFLPAAMGAVMSRDERNRLSITLGPMTANFAVLEAIDAPHRFTTYALPDRLLATTYTLDDDNGGTRLTVTLSGFEVLPEGARHDRLNLSGGAWEQALENLKAFVAGEEKPFPFAGVAPLFGFWREPENKLAIERSIWINAPRERVWRAITDPAEIEQWFSPGTSWNLSALEVGGRLSVYNPETDSDMYIQVIEYLDPPHQLIMRSQPEPPEVSHVTIWTLEEESGGTRLLLTDTGYELESDDDRMIKLEQNAFGYGMMLDNLKAVIEGDSLPVPGGF